MSKFEDMNLEFKNDVWEAEFIYDQTENECTWFTCQFQPTINSEENDYCEGGYVVGVSVDETWEIDSLENLNYYRITTDENGIETAQQGSCYYLPENIKKDFLTEIELHLNKHYDTN